MAQDDVGSSGAEVERARRQKPRMLKDIALWHLQEASEALEKLISELAEDANPDEAEYRVQVEHVYHHLNTAWNARHRSEDVDTDEEWYALRRMPRDIARGLARKT